MRAEAETFAADQSEHLAEAIAHVVVPEVDRLRAEVTNLGDAPTIARLEVLRSAVGDYSTGVVRAMSHDLSARSVASLHARDDEAAGDAAKSRAMPAHVAQGWQIVRGARINLPLALVAGVLLFVAQFNLGCTGVPALAVASFLAVMVVGGLIGQISILRRAPWSFGWLAVVAVAAFTAYRWVVESGGPACSWVTSDWELVLATAVAVIMMLGLTVVFEGVRQFSEAAVAVSHANSELEQQARGLQRAGVVTQEQIAQLLHGPVQGRLAAISMALHQHVDRVQRGEDPSMAQLHERINTLLDEVDSDVRDLVARSGAGPGPVTDFLDALAARWRGLVVLRYVVDPRADGCLAADTHLARLVTETVEEAVTNASRHGGAREVDIDFSCDPLEEGTLVVTITDDGVGPPAHVTAGLGLESVTRSGGTWVLTEQPTGGARLTARWPITHS